MRIGAHLSIAKGLSKAIEQCIEIDANTLQFFTRNPRGGRARQIPLKEVIAWQELRRKHDIFPVFAHLPYTVNLASPTASTRNFAKQVVAEDLKRMQQIGAEYLILHPGSFVQKDSLSGIRRIISALEEVLLPACAETILCLETMSGKGTEIGSQLSELGEICAALGYPPNLGICLDSCHLFAAGYDLRKEQEVDRLVEDIEQSVGLERVKVSHLNDSKVETATRKDRHERIGVGHIGEEGLYNYLHHPALRPLPFILETPVANYSQYKEEIAQARNIWCKP